MQSGLFFKEKLLAARPLAKCGMEIWYLYILFKSKLLISLKATNLYVVLDSINKSLTFCKTREVSPVSVKTYSTNTGLQMTEMSTCSSSIIITSAKIWFYKFAIEDYISTASVLIKTNVISQQPL